MSDRSVPRILVVRWDSSEHRLESLYATALRHLGAEVETFDWWRESLRAAPELAKHRFMWRPFSSVANRRLRDRVVAEKPDLVLVFKGLLVSRDTVEAVKASGSLAFCFNPDSPFGSLPGEVTEELRRALSAWDCYFIWGRFLVERLYSTGLGRVEYLPFAWDPERMPFQAPAESPRYGVSFVGTHSEHREQWLGELTDLDLHVWGPRWTEARSDVRQSVRGSLVTWPEFSDIVRDSAVSLNIPFPRNIPGHNMRTFEIPGCGGLQLSNAASEIADFFEPGKEILLFRTVEELREQASWAIAHPEERRAIASSGHGRVTEETYVHRARRIVDVWREMR